MQLTTKFRPVDSATTKYTCARFDCDKLADMVQTTENPTAFYGWCKRCAGDRALTCANSVGTLLPATTRAWYNAYCKAFPA